MPRTFLVTVLMLAGIICVAQKNKYDSIKKVLQQDSLEYEQDKKNADRIKLQTDSLLKAELGHVERITTEEDTAALRAKLHAAAQQELQRRAEKEQKDFYLYVGIFAIFAIAVIWLFKRKQFAEAEKNKT